MELVVPHDVSFRGFYNFVRYEHPFSALSSKAVQSVSS